MLDSVYFYLSSVHNSYIITYFDAHMYDINKFYIIIYYELKTTHDLQNSLVILNFNHIALLYLPKTHSRYVMCWPNGRGS